MVNDHLTLPPHLLPWLQGGLEHVLAEQTVPKDLSLCHSVHALVRPQPKAAQKAQSSHAHQAPPARPAQQAARPIAHKTAQPPPARSAGQGVPTAEARAAAPTQASPALVTLPVEHWPSIWQERLGATRPAPVLWTYWALGEDLCLTPNAQRRALLQRMLGDLGHPQGTHCFWPAALPGPQSGPQGLEANAAVFWSGVAQLGARALVVMGLPAVKALELPPNLRPLQQTRYHGRLVVVLRDADFLINEPQHYDPLREFLRKTLAPFARSKE